MIFFPAIDLKDGQCVRLEKGDMDKSTIFDSDPVSRAQSFLKAGCSWLHLVDLNGAFEGKPINKQAVENIIKNVNINIQLGGGIRSLETIDMWINTGINRVILGTMALTHPDLVIKACKKYPGKIAVGIDAREGMVAVEGVGETNKNQSFRFSKKI